jgi:hypothetical protein
MSETHLRLLALLEERVLSRLLRLLVLGEVARLASLLQDIFANTLDVHLGRGRNNVSGVDPSEGNAVDFERTGDEENTLLEVLEEDDTLAAEATSKENDDGAGCERWADLGRADGLTGLRSQLADVPMRRQSAAVGGCKTRIFAQASLTRLSYYSSIVSTLSSLFTTYLLGDGGVLSRIVLAGLLRVVRYRALALRKLLCRGFLVRHVEL